MKKNTLFALLLAVSSSVILAKEDHSEQEKKADIARHRAIAAAHEAAAQCLESGKKAEVCFKELRDSCKGLAIGKYCGMKHQH
jgi:hypothetical protein